MTDYNIVRDHIQLLHDAAKGIDGKLVLASFGEDIEKKTRLKNKIQHFKIGDVDGMTKAAIELSQEKGRNVYASLAVMRPDLPVSSKGSEEDIIASLGLVADYDDGKGVNYLERCGDLKTSFAYETSENNVQAYFMFDKPFFVENEKDRAALKEIAQKITDYCDGADKCGEDTSHVWRIPSLPNYPNEKKINAGRSAEPFVVQIKQPFTGHKSELIEFALLPSVNTTNAQNEVLADVHYIRPVNLQDLSDSLGMTILEGVGIGKRSEAVASVVSQLLHLNYGTGDIIKCIHDHPKGIGERYNGDLNRIEDDVLRLATKFQIETDEEEKRQPFNVEAFKCFNEADLEPRPFILGTHLIKRKISFLIAPPGAGKSTFSLMAGVSIVTGKNILGLPVHEKGRVAIINNEDDMDEMLKRLAGTLNHHGIEQSELEGNLFLHSGEKLQFLIAKYNLKAQTIIDHHQEDLIDDLIKNNISTLIVDPFLETHEGNENDNRDMNYVCTLYREIAQRANCAVLIVHHTRKEDGKSSGGHAGNPDSGRGASSIIGAARVVFTLYGMDESAAKHYGVPVNQKHNYVRMDDAKANLSLLSGDPKWFKRESVLLDNGDYVGVLEPEKNLMPSAIVQTTCNEQSLIAAVLHHEAFENILDKKTVGRETFIKAMEDAGVYLGSKAKRGALQNRLKDYLLCMPDDENKGIYHFGCRIYMTKQQIQNGRFKIHIELDEDVTNPIASSPQWMPENLGMPDNSASWH